MNASLYSKIAKPGDFAQLVSSNKKSHFVHLKTGDFLQTDLGIIRFNEIIGTEWGSQILSHTGNPFILLIPSIHDILIEIPRSSQIMYPKDIGYVLIKMGIGYGQNVLEAGSGSGALTTALAWAVGPQGHITSYEIREDMQNLTHKNLQRVGLIDRVTLRHKDIKNGFNEKNVDAVFLDVKNSYDYLPQVRESLKPGGQFGSILPTTNQVTRLVNALILNDFEYIDVCEIMLRFYKPNPHRLRPTDRMVAHTGFLIFARPMLLASGKSKKQK